MTLPTPPALLARRRSYTTRWDATLQAPGSLNRDAVGAEVELWSGGEPRQLRQVAAGMLGNFSAGPPAVHFGVGELDEVDLVVRWPDGSRTVNRGVPTRRGVLLVLE